jgi:hypothetical protein
METWGDPSALLGEKAFFLRLINGKIYPNVYTPSCL